jgi:hypothetical protein
MELKVSPLKSLNSKIVIFVALLLSMSATLAQTTAIQHTVDADGHPMALWLRSSQHKDIQKLC